MERGQISTRLGHIRHVNWRTIAGLVVSGVSLYIAIQNLRPAQVWRAFKHAHYLWIVPSVALYLFALVARTVRWQVLLSSQRHIPLRVWSISRGLSEVSLRFLHQRLGRVGEPA